LSTETTTKIPTKIAKKTATKIRVENMRHPTHQHSPASLCPGCERYIGAADVCPYCDADSSRAPIFRHLRTAAWVLAVAGLTGLWAAASRRDVPDLRVADITPMMNFATVRMTGEVTAKPRVRRKGDNVLSASFYLRDGSESVRVAAYDRVAQELVAREGIPDKGATATVVGRLDVRAGRRPVLRVQAADHVTVAGGGQHPMSNTECPMSK
jgi:hypothetical protein